MLDLFFQKLWNIPLKKDFYGADLTKKNVTLDHIQPKSKGGKSNLSNYVLSTELNNHKKSSKDVFFYATEKNTEEYFKAFEKINLANIKGVSYLALLSATLRRLWKQSPVTKGQEMWEVLKRY